MKRFALLILALPLAAQLQVFTLQGPAPVPLGPSVNLGAAPIRDTTEFRFRASNSGTAPLTLQTITVSGAAFALAKVFAPVTIAAGQSHDFAIRFSPAAEGSYSAGLAVNGFSTLLRAAAVPGPSLLLAGSEISGAGLRVEVPAGRTLTLALSAGNPNASAITLADVGIAGAGFSIGAPALPLVIPPGETRPIPVTFTAAAEGEFTAELIVGPRRFGIVASVFRPQLAAPRIVTSTAAPRNGQQLKVRLQLDQPAIGPGSGTLRATFAGDIDDPAILFANGAREIRFEVAAGSREASFDGASEAVIQTGTTAGTMRLEAITESGVNAETYRFERSPVVVDAAVARRSGNSLEIDITGFDNTRGVGSLNFRFFDRAGNPLGGVISTTPAEQFRAYFEQSGMGGVFRYRATFPVTGDATIVGSVLVEMANAVGRTDLQRLTFP